MNIAGNKISTQLPASKTTAQRLILIALCLFITSCGFSLRGNDVLTSKFQTLRLQLENEDSEFARSLVRSLRNADVQVEIIDDIDFELTSPVLRVSDEQVRRRAVTINQRARAAQYELKLTVTAAFGQGETLLFGPTSLSVEKIYFEDIENIVGSQEEIEIISDEMRRELVAQLLGRLEAIDGLQ